MRISVIVNPKAGRQTIQKHLEQIISKLSLESTVSCISVTHTQKKNDAYAAALACNKKDTDLIIGCGGDGTINEVVNGIMRSDSGIPLAILAAGTSNDLAASLHLPDDTNQFCAMIKNGEYRKIDVGLVNGDTYLVNVAAFGMFTDIAYKTNRERKNSLGKTAYYMQAATSAPDQLIKSFDVSIKTDEQYISGKYAICIIANSSSVGAFRKLMYKADIYDGRFDVLLMEKRGVFTALKDSLNIITNAENAKTPSIKYFQTSKIEITSPSNEDIEVDLDGEYYGSLPLSIEVCPQALTVLVPKNNL